MSVPEISEHDMYASDTSDMDAALEKEEEKNNIRVGLPIGLAQNTTLKITTQ